MKLKLNKDLHGKKKGTVIEIADRDGSPLDTFWYRRLKDAEIDNCVEVVSGTYSKTTKKEKFKDDSLIESDS